MRHISFLILLFLLGCFYISNAQLPGFVSAEYYFDTDPGFGNGTQLVVSADSLIDENFSIPINNLNDGYHKLYVRTKDNAGNWSMTAFHAFYKKSESIYAVQALQNIVAVESFFDTDPGLGNGNQLTISVDSLIDENYNIPVTGLALGYHKLYVRTKDEAGKWSMTYSHVFYKKQETVSVVQNLPNIDAVEYYFDIDPGFGNGNQLTVSADSLIEENDAISVDNLPLGYHKLYVRTKDETGKWSLTYNHAFYKKQESVFPVQNLSDIVAVEYYFDTDPGFGNGTPLTVSADSLIEENDAISVDNLPLGYHKLYVRTKDETGKWSLTYNHAFYKKQESVFPVQDFPNIVAVEYYFDNDPGFGNGASLTVSADSLVEENYNIPVDSLPAGYHKLYVRTQDETGNWGMTYHHTFYKLSEPVFLAAPLPNLVAAEYFFDADPGFGYGTHLSFTPDSVLDLDFIPDISSLSGDIHTFYIRVKDENGKWSLIYQEEINIFLFAMFSASETEITEGDTIQFTDLSTGNTIAWSWDFGDGTSDTTQNPMHSYSTPGLYTVTLVVFDNVTNDTLIRSDYIKVNPVDNPILSISPEQLNYGIVTTSPSQDSTLFVLLKNMGTGILTIDSLYGLEAPFSIDSITFPISIQANDSIVFPLILERNSLANTYFDTLLIASNSNQNPNLVNPLSNDSAHQVYVQATLVDQPQILFTATNVSCFGGSDGAIDISVTSGIPPYTYLWNFGSTLEDLENLFAGIYSLTVTDSFGTSNQTTITIASPAAIQLTSVMINETAIGTTDGAIDLSVSGGTPPYQFAWSNGASTEDLTNITAGNYQLTVTDTNNCSATGTFEILVTPPMTLLIYADKTIVCNGDSCTITAVVNAGSENYSFQWSSDPVGFSSNDSVIIVTPTANTWYFIEASDGITVEHDSVYIQVVQYNQLATYSNDSLLFPEQVIKSNTQRIVIIKNEGCETLTVDSVQHQSNQFLCSPGNFILPPGDSLNFMVFFSPLVVDTFIDTIHFYGNFAGGVFQNISLEGISRKPFIDFSFAGAVSIFPESPSTKDSIQFSVDIEYNGEQNTSSVQCRFQNSLPGIEETRLVNYNFKPGDIISRTFTLSNIPDTGSYSWTVLLDPNDFVDETNENNNSVQVTTNIITPPELSISSLVLSQDSIMIGDEASGTFIIHNDGEAQANVEYNCKAISNQGIENVVASGIQVVNGNSLEQISFNFYTLGTPGIQSIIVTIDPNNLYEELLETDNQADTSFVCLYPSPTLAISGSPVHNLNDTSSYEISIVNNCLVSIQNVILSLTVPEIFDITSTNPAASGTTVLLWQWNELPSFAAEVIDVSLLLSQLGNAAGSIVPLEAELAFQVANSSDIYTENTSLTVQLGLDSRPPVLNLTANSINLSGGNMQLSLTANEDLQNFPSVSFINATNDTLFSNVFTGALDSFTYSFALNNLWSDGNYKLFVKASDLSNNESTCYLNVKLDTKAPEASIIAPDKVSHTYFDIGLEVDELLSTDPVISILIPGSNNLLPQLDSKFGLDYQYKAMIPANSSPTGITIQVELTDLAGNDTIFTKEINTDFIAPVLTHTFPSTFELDLVTAEINSNEALIGNPDVWITSLAGTSIPMQGPFAIDTATYAIYFAIDDSYPSGEYDVLISATDVAGNERTVNHTMVCDHHGPAFDVVFDPAYPSGNFTMKIFPSEPLSAEPELVLLGSQPFDTVAVPTPQWVSDHYEYSFVSTYLSEIQIAASDTLGNPGAYTENYIDLELPKLPFNFSGNPDGSSDISVFVPCKNNTGVDVHNIPVVLFDSHFSVQIPVCDTLFLNIPAHSSVNAEFTWESQNQHANYSLLARINPDVQVPEKSLANNFSYFKRLDLQTWISRTTLGLGIDSSLTFKADIFNSTHGYHYSPGEINAHVKLIAANNTVLLNNILPQQNANNFVFDIDLSMISDTGTFCCQLVIDDSTGLAPIVDNTYFTVIRPLIFSVATDKTIYNRDENVVISGSLIDTDGFGIPDTSVSILISNSIGDRTYNTSTDTSGNYSLVFNPYAQEAGNYNVSVYTSIGDLIIESDTGFSITGLLFAPYEYNIKLSRNSSHQGYLKLNNIGAVLISGISISLQAPANTQGISIVLEQYLNTLGPGSSMNIPFTVVSPPGNPANVDFNIIISSNEQQNEQGVFHIETGAAQPILNASAGNTQLILRHGETASRRIYFVNNGYIAAHNLELSTPTIPFVQIISPPQIQELAVGDTAFYDLLFNVDTSITDALYTEFLTLSCSNHPDVQTGLSVFITHNTGGNLSVSTQSSTGNSLGNALVYIYSQEYNPYTQSYPVYSMYTDTNGVAIFDSIPSGDYKYKITAENHNPRIGDVHIEPTIDSLATKSIYQTETVVLEYYPFTYEWSVEEATIQDEYIMTVDMAIQEVEVLPPCIVVSPNVLAHNFSNNSTILGEFTLTNYGGITGFDIATDSTTMFLVNSSNEQLYKITLTNIPEILSLGLPNGGTATVSYIIERLFTGANQNHIQTWISPYNTGLLFTGKYDLNGNINNFDFTVDIDVQSNDECGLSFSSPILHRTFFNGELISSMSSNALVITNNSNSENLYFDGGAGMFFIDKGFGFESTFDYAMDAAAGGAWSYLTLALDLAEIAMRAGSGDFDASVSSSTIPADSTVRLPVNWAIPDPSLDVATISFGLFIYSGDQLCPFDYEAGVMPITSLTIDNVFANIIGAAQSFSQSSQYPPSSSIPSSSSSSSSSGSSGGNGSQASVSVVPAGPGGNSVEVSGNTYHLELTQSLTLERQAFNISLKLNNETNFDITNFNMDVLIKNELNQVVTQWDQGTANPLFFQEPALSNISAIDSTGLISANQSAEISWLAIPKAGSGGTDGNSFFLQGHFSFTINNQPIDIYTEESEITILPLPSLEITYGLPEYFNTGDFYISSSITNSGFGSAQSVSLETFPPEVTNMETNETANVITLEGAYFQDNFIGNSGSNGSVVINFGNIGHNQTKVGHLQFNATFNGIILDPASNSTTTIYHPEELGGEATSLVALPQVYTLKSLMTFGESLNNSKSQLIYKNSIPQYTSVHVMDSSLNGVPDYILIESSGEIFPVSANTYTVLHQCTFAEPYFTIQVQNNQGWSYVEVPLPFNGTKIVSDISTNTGYQFTEAQYWIENQSICLANNATANQIITISFRDIIEPDLAIFQSDLAWVPEYPLDNQTISLNCNITNSGDLMSDTTSIVLNLLADTIYQTIAVEGIPEINGFGVYHLTLNISSNLLDYGWNTLQLILDPDSLLPETSRLNNLIEFSVFKNRNPILYTSQMAIAYPGLSYIDTLFATDPDVIFGDSISYELLSNSGWLSVDESTGIISGLPDSSHIGVNTFIVKANDAFGAYDLKTMNVIVDSILPKYNVIVTIEPNDGGSVSGTGEFDMGTTVSLMATPEIGYSFVSWIEGGLIISTNTVFSFDLYEDRNLIALFEAPAPNWTYSDTGVYHSILIADTIPLLIDDVPLTIGDYVGVFYDSLGVAACGGYLRWKQATDTIRAYPSLGGNEGFTQGEEFSFKMWRCFDNREFGAVASYIPPPDMPDQGFFNSGGESGLMKLEAELDSQIINLPFGWSIFSSYLSPVYFLLDSLMAPAITNVIIVKDDNGQVWWPNFGINNIGDITIGKGYQVKMLSTSFLLLVKGDLVQPELTPITFPVGWSIIGYLRTSPAPIDSLLSTISSSIIIVKSGQGGVYWPLFGVNNIGNMEPGRGYQVKMLIQENYSYPAN